MSGNQYLPSEYGLSRVGATSGLIASGSIFFSKTAVKTTEISSGTIASTGTMIFHPDDYFLLAVTNPADDSSGSSFGVLTIKTYNTITIPGMINQNYLHTTQSVGSASATSYTDFLIQGLFVGGGASIGMSFASDVRITSSVDYALFRL